MLKEAAVVGGIGCVLYYLAGTILGPIFVYSAITVALKEPQSLAEINQETRRIEEENARIEKINHARDMFGEWNSDKKWMIKGCQDKFIEFESYSCNRLAEACEYDNGSRAQNIHLLHEDEQHIIRERAKEACELFVLTNKRRKSKNEY